jgi:hypothetical protein
LPSKLAVASGGSGDLVAAWALARTWLPERTVAYAAPIWERILLDPQPGPRTRAQIANLASDRCGWRVVAETSLPGGWSPLPCLVSQTGVRLYYLDVSLGARGVARQLQRICDEAEIDLIELVDAGGDVLARGDEPGLLSPALDSVILGACTLVTVPTVVTVVGEGLDGELSGRELAQARAELSSLSSGYIPAPVARDVYTALSWFPSEASLMTLLAAAGLRGDVDVRADTCPVRVDRDAAVFRTYSLASVTSRNTLVRAVRHSTSIAEVDSILRAKGCVSELGREQASRDAATSGRTAMPLVRVPALTTVLESVHANSTHVSLRRMCKVMGLGTRSQADALDVLLMDNFGKDYRKPLLLVSALREFILDVTSHGRTK